jgi:hypothetical protein
MAFAGPEPHDVTGANFFDRSTIPLHASTTSRDDQRLAEWMCMPGGPGAWLKGHHRAADAGGCLSLKRRVDPHGTRKPLRGTFAWWL